MMDAKAKLEIAQLIQDYFLWVFTNPEEATKLSTVPSLPLSSKGKTTYSDLLGLTGIFPMARSRHEVEWRRYHPSPPNSQHAQRLHVVTNPKVHGCTDQVNRHTFSRLQPQM